MIIKSCFGRGLEWKIGGCVTLAAVLSIGVSENVLAQIVPDKTLGVEGSVVKPNVNIQGIPSDRIDGGATRGANLFHSFQEFNVGSGRGAYFANPTGIENILTRVTGSNASNILGRLGVLGGANLFLLNPNGIVFGANASLDIQGSFVATTSERIQLGDSGYFSAAQPQTSSLLSVTPGALFFSQVANQPTAIINQGNLSTGKHLTLSAGNLDLQGQLLSGGDLTLQATDTVKVRDRVTTPFLAQSGGNLTVIGNADIDILAVNHPTQTQFVSGGNLSLVSNGIIYGDARFSSGGDFSITASGNITTGGINSETNGSGKGGDITLTSNNGAIDTKKGTVTSQIQDDSGGTGNGGAIVFKAKGDIETATLNSSAESGNGSLIHLTSINGNIDTSRGSLFSDSRSGNGGEIRLEAPKSNITTGDLISYSYSTSGSVRNGGKIGLQANGNISTGNLDSASYSENGNSANGGEISVNSVNGDITASNLYSLSYSSSNTTGSGSAITLSANGKITTGGINSETNGSGKGGDITLTSNNGAIDTKKGTVTSQIQDDSGGTGNGGAIVFKAKGDIETATLNSGAESGNGSLIHLTSINGNIDTTRGTLFSDSRSGNGGEIRLEASKSKITAGGLVSRSYSTSGSVRNGGKIGLQANGNISTGNLDSASYSGNGSSANGGKISLNSANGDIETASNLYSLSYSSSNTTGSGGAITLSANGKITTGGINSETNGSGKGGDITLTSNNGAIDTKKGTVTSQIRDDSGGTGNGGAIVFKAKGDIETATLNSGAESGNGSLIHLTSINGNIDTTRGTLFSDSRSGNGGEIRLEASKSKITAGGLVSRSYSTSGSVRNGGKIGLQANGNISTGNLDSASYSGNGNSANGGEISLNSANGDITASNLYSFSYSSSNTTGSGGAIALTAQNNITTGNLDSNSNGAGNGGNITLLSTSGSIDTSKGALNSTSNTGNGGAITLTAENNIIMTGGLDSDSYVSSISEKGNGGAITISAGGNFTTSNLAAFSKGEGNGGTITINAGGDIISTWSLDTWSLEGKGNGGVIAVTAGGNFTAFGLNSYSNEGNGGAITVTADGDITLKYRDAAISSSYGGGNGGAIALTAGGNITASDFISRNPGIGNGGEITLTASGDVTTGNLISGSTKGNGGAATITSTNGRIALQSGRYGQFLIDTEGVNGGDVTLSSPNQGFVFENPNDDLSRPSGIYSDASNGNGGNIQITAPSVTLTDIELNTSTRSQGNAGNISILTNGLVTLDGSRLFTSLEPGGIGRGGDITIDAGAVSLTNASFIDTATFGQGKAGDVSLQVDDSISLANDSAIFSFTAGQGDGGHVKLEAGGGVSLTNRSNISTAVNSRAQGDGGDIEITARSLSLTGGSQLVTSTSSSGKAGEITVSTIEGIFISGTDPNFIPPKNFLIGNPPPLAEVEPNDSIAQAQPLTQFFLNSPDDVNSNVEDSIQNPYVFIAGTSLSSDYDIYSFEVTAPGTRGIFRYAPGYIDIYNSRGNQVVLSSAPSRVGPDDRAGFGNSVIRYVFSEPGIYYVNPSGNPQGAYTFQVSLETPNITTSVINGTLPSGLFARTEGAGAAGSVIINTPQLSVTDGGNVSATATAAATSTARGGNIEVNSSLVNLQGYNSGLFAQTQGAAPAGSLTLNPDNNGQILRVNLQDNAQISASTSGSGQGGSLSIKAPQVATISGKGQLSVETSSTGAGGNLAIDTQRLTIQDGAQVSASTSSPNSNGVGGNIRVNATQSFDLSNGARLLAESNGAAPAGNVTINTGNLTASQGTIATSSELSSGGDITITASDIRLFDDSDIRTNVASGAGGGGNINLAANSIIAFGDSDILAYADPNDGGKGGNITLNTPAFLGENYRPAPRNTDPRTLDGNSRVDVNATGAINGVITLPDISFIQNSLTELPENQINTDSLLANSCIVRRNQPTRGTFTITGTGGLPQRPGDAQMSSFPTVDVKTLPSDSTLSNTNPNPSWQKSDPIVEPLGVYRLPNGKLVLSRECS